MSVSVETIFFSFKLFAAFGESSAFSKENVTPITTASPSNRASWINFDGASEGPGDGRFVGYRDGIAVGREVCRIMG